MTSATMRNPLAPPDPTAGHDESAWPEPKPDGREYCPCYESRRLARRVNLFYETTIGLTAAQFSLVGFALARPGVSISEMARLLDVDRTTVTRNLAILERLGLVRQEAAPKDARRRALYTTAEGRIAWRAGLAAWRAAQARFKQQIGGQESFDALIGLLRQTADLLPGEASNSAI
ncbi:MarR family winged helix-turn-helix transcriptional regulator [Ferrovibrio sp.]|uniref:MarR family winged helix-turn-helix transcriptional regulator n=1 Tax=Ferrovibrio sp. TaxID=1917215 RepID=UPI003D0B0DC0